MLQIPPYSYFTVENSRFNVQTLVIMVKSSHFSLLCCFTILNSSQKVLRISWVCFAYNETPFSLKKNLWSKKIVFSTLWWKVETLWWKPSCKTISRYLISILRAESSVNSFHKKLISQNWFLKKHFDWVIAKIVLISANRNTQIWEFSYGELVFAISIRRWVCP